MEVANAAADAVEARHGTDWARGNSCEVICTYTMSRKKKQFPWELQKNYLFITNIQQ